MDVEEEQGGNRLVKGDGNAVVAILGGGVHGAYLPRRPEPAKASLRNSDDCHLFYPRNEGHSQCALERLS